MSTFYIPLKKYLKDSGKNRNTYYYLCKRAKESGDESRFKYIDGKPYINITYYEDAINEEVRAGELYYKARSFFKNDGLLARRISEITGINYQTVYGYLRAFKFKSAEKRRRYMRAFIDILKEKGMEL